MNEEQQLIAKFMEAVTKDLQSYKEALDRLAENQAVQHRMLTEMVEQINRQAALVSEITAQMTAHLLPDDKTPSAVN